MLAAEEQTVTGRNMSANEALWNLLQEHRRDLTERALKASQEEKAKKKAAKKEGKEE